MMLLEIGYCASVDIRVSGTVVFTSTTGLVSDRTIISWLAAPEVIMDRQSETTGSAANDNGVAPLMRQLVAMSKMINLWQRLQLATLGLRPGQDDVLLILDAHAPMSTSAVAGRLRLALPDASVLIDQLVLMGLAERCGRAGEATATSTGSNAQEAVRRIRKRLASELSQALESTATHAQLERLRLRLTGVVSRSRSMG